VAETRVVTLLRRAARPEHDLFCVGAHGDVLTLGAAARRPVGYRQPTAAERFTSELWSGIDGTYRAILEHPFILGLTDGSLERASFEFYVVQDAHYLREYARALSVTAARAPAEADIAMFCEHASGAIAVERSLHESFFSDFGVSEEDVAKTAMAPTNLAYTSYLLATAYGASFGELLGAVVPCYWIYWEVGKALLERGSPDPLYARWIETYGGEEFAEVVRAVLAFTDRVGPELSPTDRRRAADRFATTARYEWMFWEMGYRRERWPI
jgi:thiaminase/transcriptional activator TenA